MSQRTAGRDPSAETRLCAVLFIGPWNGKIMTIRGQRQQERGNFRGNSKIILLKVH